MTATEGPARLEAPAALAALLDREAVVDVAVRCATALDTRDWVLLRTCFTDDAVAEYEGLGESRGAGAIEAVCRRALTPLDASQHLLSNFAVAVAGDLATMVCYYHAQHLRHGTPGGPTHVLAGRYVDRLVRSEGGWRIAHRQLSVVWSDGDPAVLAHLYEDGS